MTVAEVWGRIQGSDAFPVIREGEDWIFDVPSWAATPIVAEFWAKDEAGNIGYRAAVLEIEKGGVKCIRWMHTDGVCRMLAHECAETR